MAILGKKTRNRSLRAIGICTAKSLLKTGFEKISGTKYQKRQKQKKAVGKALVWGVSTGAAAGLVRYWIKKQSYGV